MWARQPRGESPHFPTLVKCPLPGQHFFPLAFHSSFWEERDDQALLLWMLGLLREQDGPHQPGNPRGKGTKPQRGLPLGLGLGGCRGRATGKPTMMGRCCQQAPGAEQVAPVRTEPKEEFLYHQN